MARNEIRGQRQSNGDYIVTPRDLYNINNNFQQVSQEVFGNANFSRKVEKRVKKAEGQIEDIITEVGVIDEEITVVKQTATDFSIEVRDKLDTTTHKFTKEGYILKDSSGGTLITPNGMANEQNIGRVDNVQSSYPMKLPFHIGNEVSQINQAILKWDISPFRTYSKGAATYEGVKTTPDGGGRTSGSSSRSTSEFDAPPNFSTGYQINDADSPGNHFHVASSSAMSHRHNMEHTHYNPDHSHSVDLSHDHLPEFGILEKAIPDTWLNIWVDGANVYSVDALRGEVDLSLWITTNGWHTLELRCWDMYRLDANLFLKTYIRR